MLVSNATPNMLYSAADEFLTLDQMNRLTLSEQSAEIRATFDNGLQGLGFELSSQANNEVKWGYEQDGTRHSLSVWYAEDLYHAMYFSTEYNEDTFAQNSPQITNLSAFVLFALQKILHGNTEGMELDA